MAIVVRLSGVTDPLRVLGSLTDATRRRIYEHVARQAAPVSRDEAAAAAGVGRTLAAYHLDRLAAEGLLSVSYERRTGRRGPGAGRPANAAAGDAHGDTRRALAGAAERLGAELAVEAGGDAELEPLLRARGYEP